MHSYAATLITMLIRQAIPDDAEISCDILRRSIIDLCRADHNDSPDYLTEWLRNKTPEIVRGWYSDPENFCVVAELNNEIVGVGSINTKGELGLLYVSPTARFRGVIPIPYEVRQNIGDVISSLKDGSSAQVRGS
jgi:hypothetical protein